MTTDELRTWMKALEERDVRIVALEKRLAALEAFAQPPRLPRGPTDAERRDHEDFCARLNRKPGSQFERPLLEPATDDGKPLPFNPEHPVHALEAAWGRGPTPTERRWQTLQHLAWALGDGLRGDEVEDYVKFERSQPGAEPKRGRPSQELINRASRLLDKIDALAAQGRGPTSVHPPEQPRPIGCHTRCKCRGNAACAVCGGSGWLP